MEIKVTTKETEDISGTWAEDDRCMMALITKQELLNNIQAEALPYVCAYIKNERGGMDIHRAFALRFSDNRLCLQIFSKDGKQSRLVQVEDLYEMLGFEEANENESVD